MSGEEKHDAHKFCSTRFVRRAPRYPVLVNQRDSGGSSSSSESRNRSQSFRFLVVEITVNLTKPPAPSTASAAVTASVAPNPNTLQRTSGGALQMMAPKKLATTYQWP